MGELQCLDGYTGQTVEELIALEGTYRIDSLVLAFEQAMDQKAARVGDANLSDEETIILAVEALQREVCNGGYGQFFANSSSEYAPVILNALERIGCPKTVEITARALENGNTLIAGNNNRVIEVNPQGKIVWSLDQKELPGITLAWVTTLHVLPNGDIIVGNCHAGKDNPQLFQVTRKKQIVWTFRDFENFGNGLAAAHVLDLPEGTKR